MEWTQRKLAHYLGEIKTVVEFQGITGDELKRAFEGEAMYRLKRIEQELHNEYTSDREKLEEIMQLIDGT